MNHSLLLTLLVVSFSLPAMASQKLKDLLKHSECTVTVKSDVLVQKYSEEVKVGAGHIEIAAVGEDRVLKKNRTFKVTGLNSFSVYLSPNLFSIGTPPVSPNMAWDYDPASFEQMLGGMFSISCETRKKLKEI